ncbi:MAG: hypothetical protein JSW51_01550 [Gemmatimonadota bacterium]|nr:MAG: hypothetical protein JSW51_01550 [Gemmatimonadota bacterium]
MSALLVPVVLSAVFLAAGPAAATATGGEEPYLALRTGLKCSTCHVNRSGGGGRNDFGNAWAQTQLPARTAEVRSRALNDWVALGFDLRVFAATAVSETTPRSEVGIQEAQIQLEAKLIRDALSFYVDQTLGPGSATPREVFGLWHGLPLDTYVKAGKFMLPYGWRLWDDNAYIRQETGFTYRTPEIGVEVGLEPGPMSVFVALSNGTTASVENDSQKKLTTSAAYVHRQFRVGGSFAHNSDATTRTNTTGAFGGFNIGPLAVLGEVDYIFNELRDTTSGSTEPPNQFVGYVEGNLLATRGLNAKVTYGYHDPDRSVSENQRIRMRFGLEWFPISFVQLAAFYTMLEDVPEVETDIDVVSLELHLHF